MDHAGRPAGAREQAPALGNAQFWTRVQQLGGIRKWNAPTSIAYFGYSSAWWVRDLNLCTLRFAAEEEADG